MNSNESAQPLKHLPSKWTIINKLGNGSYGTVYKAKNLNGVKKDKKVDICAIKIIEKKLFNQVEIDVLKKVKSMYGFLEYYGYGIDDNNYYLYMEYIDGAISITDRLNEGYKFRDDEIIDISRKVLEAIKHLHHYHNIAHRDIKSDHILLIYGNDNDGNNKLKGIKLIDFGCSKILEINNTKYNTSVGTEGYMAPEVKLQNGKASRKSDIYSFGCVLFEMLGGDLSNTNDQNIPIIPNTIPLKFKLIIQKCLVYDPNGRSTANEILKHVPYLNPLKLNNRQLKLGNNVNLSSYNHSALTEGVIPNSFTDLDLSSYNHPIMTGTIPNSVEYLNLSSYNHSALTVGVIPNSVKYLNLSSYNHELTVGVIPNSVTNLNLSSYNHPALTEGVIPNSVKKLNLSSYNHSALTTGVIPTSVTELNLSSYNHSALKVGVIPNNVSDLNLSSYNHSALTTGVIPNRVKYFNLSSYNHPIMAGVIPNGMKKLNLSSYNHSALSVGVIPNSVTNLNLSSYNHSALTVGAIPKSVFHLDLSSYNHSALTVGVIPNSVGDFNLSSYNHPLSAGVIPKTI